MEPLISELVQTGVVGICLALVGALIYIVRLFTTALLSLSEVVRNAAVTIERLNERIERCSGFRHAEKK